MEMEMEKQLYEAALEGDVTLLKTLLQKDPLILDRISPTFLQETPLHVAILRGHVDFAREVLSRNPRSMYELDSLGHSPLHAAAAKGRAEIVRELLRLDHATGLVRSKDGMVPLHLAIMKGGRVEVVSELARGCPQSLTRSRTDQGDTGLHLCVKYDNLEALQVLMEMQENSSVNLLNVTNYDGNTVLHLAALHKNLEIMKYLLSKPGIEMNAVNKNGLTCLDLIENSSRDIKGLEIHNFLLQSNAQKGLNCNTYTTPPVKSQASVDPGQRGPKSSWKKFFTFSDNPRLEQHRGSLLIVATIIAASMAIPIINMNVNGPDLTTEYSKYSVTFVPSAAIMVLLVSGFSLNNKLCVWIIVQLMYTAIGFLGLNFIESIISNENRYLTIDAATLILMLILFVLLMLASALNIIRLIVWVVMSVKGCVQKKNLSANSGTTALSSR